jgi:hypothetical protein
MTSSYQAPRIADGAAWQTGSEATPIGSRHGGRASRSRAGSANLVILRTDSYESLMKANVYIDVAKRLGLSVREHPDKRTVAIIPASEFRAMDAAWMARTYGVPGPDPVAVATVTNKALAYQFLRRKGFEVLDWMVPVREQDLRRSLGGPVIVKPEIGSGSSSRQPWGYRVFDDVPDFRRYLYKEKQLDRFLSMQFLQPLERMLVMEYVEGDFWSMAAVAGEGRPEQFDSNVQQMLADSSKLVGRQLIGARHPDERSLMRMMSALAEAGLRRSVIWIQCVARKGRLYPFDLNLRTGQMWQQAAFRLGVPALDEVLSVMLGLKRKPCIRWPGRYVGVVRVPVELRSGVYRATCSEPDAVPVIDRLRYDPAKPYDRGHAYPVFAVVCRRQEEFEQRAAAIVAGTRLTPLRNGR